MTKKQKDALINEVSCNEIYYSSSFIRFLENNSKTNKIARLLYHHYENPFKPAYRFMFTTSEVNYITLRNDGTISFLPAGKEHKLNDDRTWSREGRQNGKPSKVIRKLFTQSALSLIKDSDFESFTNKYKAAAASNEYTFSILPASKIPSIYRLDDSDRIEGDAGLNDSCMNNEDRNFFDIYKHCKQLSILVMHDKDGKLGGRALLWSLKHNNNDITLMDRIYVAQDHMFELFIEYAKENSFWYKVKYGSREPQDYFMQPNGESIYKSFKIYTDTDFDAYPYIDTFQYGGNGWLSNVNDNAYYDYDCTNGDRSGDDESNGSEIYDEIDQEYISEDDAVCIDRGEKRGMWTHENNVVRVGGYWYWKDDSDVVYLSSHGYCHIDDVVFCERDSEDYHRDDCVQTHDDEWILESESVETENGYIYHENDDDIICIDGKWYQKDDDDVCEHDGEYYHKSDTDNTVVTYCGTLTHKSNVVTALHDDNEVGLFLQDDDDVIEIDGKYYHTSYKGLYLCNVSNEYRLRQLAFEFNAAAA